MRSPRSFALTVAIAFGGVGVLWVLVMDILMYAVSDNAVLRAKLELAVDWGFVAIASIVLYIFVHRTAARLYRTCVVLSSVVDSIGDGLLLLGRRHTIVYANPAAVRMLECGDAAELVGMDASAFARRFLVTYPSGALVTPDAFASQRAFQARGPVHYKCVLHPARAHEIVIDSTAAPVRSRPERNPAMVVSLMHDVTDTEHLAEIRDRFFAAAAHSLKTPIAVIKANVQFLGRSASPGSRPSFAAVERQCDRIDRIVQNLQIVARARSHSLRLYLHDIELEPLIVQAAHDLAQPRFAREVRLEIEASPHVRGDRDRLSTLLHNLASDALQSSPSHSPLMLRLSVDGSRAEISIRFEVLAVSERTFAGVDKYDDATLGRCATETIAEAHGGQLGEEVGEREAKLWVRLPIIEERNDRDDRHPDRG